jgi:uncharacterized damage-inducible protein DinB
MSEPEYWLRGAIAGVPPLLQPVAHALLQVRDEVTRVVAPLGVERLWSRTGDAATIGFHVKHLSGSVDRLLTYARGEELSAGQLAYLNTEQSGGDPPADASMLLAALDVSIERALAQVRATADHQLLDARSVGRKALPSTVIGLLFHAAEHAARHAGQIVTTAKIHG